MDLANVKKGEGQLKLEIKDGKVVSSLVFDGKQMDVKLSIELDIEAYGELLKNAIPGTIDDAVIALIVSAMKA